MSVEKKIAGDALASVDGFRIMIHLTFEHLFGIRFCPNCPDCNVTGNPCQDIFGSVATAQGGIFGRVDAVFTSIEAQKSTGSLHAHSQLFIQCLHQHTSLDDIVTMLRQNCSHIVEAYLDYKTHVCRQVYSTETNDLEERLDTHEATWPEYTDSSFLVIVPSYMQPPQKTL